MSGARKTNAALLQVWLETGVACDRKYAEAYLQAGHCVCPVTGEHLSSRSVAPVTFLKGMIKR